MPCCECIAYLVEKSEVLQLGLVGLVLVFGLQLGLGCPLDNGYG